MPAVRQLFDELMAKAGSEEALRELLADADQLRAVRDRYLRLEAGSGLELFELILSWEDRKSATHGEYEAFSACLLPEFRKALVYRILELKAESIGGLRGADILIALRLIREELDGALSAEPPRRGMHICKKLKKGE